MSLSQRQFSPQLSLRSDGRTLAGIAVPFGQITDLGFERELFVKGSFTRTLKNRPNVKLLANHNGQAFPIGKATLLREDAAGLYAEFGIVDTVAGNEALTLVRDGVVDGLSVGFKVVDDHYPEPDLREVREAELFEVSLVTWPAYEGARVMSLRSARNLIQTNINEGYGDTGHSLSLQQARSLLLEAMA